jgi:ornithine carbamoyltransferase
MTRHFLTLNDISQDEAWALINRAIELKAMVKGGEIYEPLKNKTLSMIFEKSSTRTRVSFETGMTQFGGHALFLSSRDTQLGRGEPVADTARVLSQMVDGIMIRNDSQAQMKEFASFATVPVINALSDLYHPCQLLADMQTWLEVSGDFRGKTAAWIGDGNNVANSFINAAKLFGFTLRVCTPKGYEPDANTVAAAGDSVIFIDDPKAVAEGCDLIVTDTWISMGEEDGKAQKIEDFTGFIVDNETMGRANDDAVFMHCLPAYREYEVSTEVFEGPQSVVFQEAGNRLHAQKALLELLLK